mmetsp:Transcript_19080/g.23650  ORF Transcript_19080/g.23650 Transcript_19080/m.23650 type:complete len:283 (+) Transcript_19080:112-960(+)
MDVIIAYLTGKSYLSVELRTFFQAFLGAMAVRNGPNKEKNLNWFHAFVLSVLAAFAGGTFAPLWLGKPSSLLSNDLTLASCIVAFVLVNCTPMDVGHRLGMTFPVVIVATAYSQLFKIMGLIGFANAAYNAFKDNPSDYYPIPVFGPIVYATLLGNMGGFFLKGVKGHLEKGMPWTFQSGLACASFYHFYTHDKTGVIGVTLRSFVDGVLPSGVKMGLDDATFAVFAVSAFQHCVAFLQLPNFFGPNFSPFLAMYGITARSTRKDVGQETEKISPKEKQKSS